jgi:glutathione S-transferase
LFAQLSFKNEINTSERNDGNFNVINFSRLKAVFSFTLKTGVTCLKMDVLLPKTCGNEIRERLFRVQQNTLEQLIVFIPSVMIFSHYISHIWGYYLGHFSSVGKFMPLPMLKPLSLEC